jgi:DNA-binding response OmpR family regulator
MMVKTRILVVDDEVNILKYMRANLEASGYEVLTAGDGFEALQIFERELPDLVILDLRMPKMDGFEVCRRIREFAQTPIIVLTTLGSQEDKIKCFDLGADDYVTKPFSKNELLARVKALLRRTTLWDERPEPALHFHDLVIDFAQHRVTLGSQDVKLTATEYKLLSYLARNVGRLITPEQILEKVWGEEYVGETHLLHVAMARLRQKLGDDAKEPRFIVTKIGIGYMFLKPS